MNHVSESAPTKDPKISSRMTQWWYKPSEKLPDHKEQVLVRRNDQVNLAQYDAERGLFYLRDGKSIYSVKDDIVWMCTLRPEGL